MKTYKKILLSIGITISGLLGISGLCILSGWSGASYLGAAFPYATIGGSVITYKIVDIKTKKTKESDINA